MRTLVKSAARTLDLLELMAALPHPLRLNEAARRMGIPKSSAHALLNTLEAKGYVVAGADGFRLAEQFRNGGWAGGHFAHLTRIARPAMMRLVSETGESTFLGIMTSDWSVQYIDKIASANAVRYDADLTTVRPAYNTSIGHVFLADQPDAVLRSYLATHPLKRETPYTVIDPDELVRVLARVRERGYAEADRSHAVDSAGVAAGIRGPDSRVIAAVSVVAPHQRFASIRAVAVAAVQAAAEGISAGLRRMDGSQLLGVGARAGS